MTLPDKHFELSRDEIDLLDLAAPDKRAKNVSLSANGVLGRTSATDIGAAGLTSVMKRYAGWSRALIDGLATRYIPTLEPGRTSYRPRPIDNAPLSPRKDDRRLHIDAFASQPTGGKRILRVFSNINPSGEARVWRVGEPFEAYARRWLGEVRRPWPGEASALLRLGVTKARRTPPRFPRC